MTYEEKQPRPDPSSQQPHWENNSLGSSSYDPYIPPPGSPYSEQWPNDNPSHLYNQNQAEPYWAHNPTPNPSSPSPQYSSNGLSPKGLRSPNQLGISPEELAAMRSEAEEPNSPAPKQLEPKGAMGYSLRELKEIAKLVAKPSEYRTHLTSSETQIMVFKTF
jgi:hypothetical protein